MDLPAWMHERLTCRPWTDDVETLREIVRRSDSGDGLAVIEATALLRVSSDVRDRAKEYLAHTRSPIEAAMLCALWLQAARLGMRTHVSERGLDALRRFQPDGYTESFVLYVHPQCPIGGYVADFVLVLAYYSAGVGGEVQRAECVVECDGHDFHERTKEQAAHDRKRDREMQMDGWKVFRFTGSEIHANPMRCAWDAFSALVLPETKWRR